MVIREHAFLALLTSRLFEHIIIPVFHVGPCEQANNATVELIQVNKFPDPQRNHVDFNVNRKPTNLLRYRLTCVA